MQPTSRFRSAIADESPRAAVDCARREQLVDCARPEQLVDDDNAPRAQAQSAPWFAAEAGDDASGCKRCRVCLETIPLRNEVCPECAEPASTMRDGSSASAIAPISARPASLQDFENVGTSWLAMHWRPLLTIGTMIALVCSGVALRYLAPGKLFSPRAAARQATVAPACAKACWSGEACQLGECVWQAPNDMGHLPAAPLVSGPFPLPQDASDVLPLDGERFAVALLAGAQIANARSGEILSLVSDAPQVRHLYRVGDVVYAASPQRIYVIDAATTRLVKTIEVGSPVESLTIGAAGRRALASLPNAHAVAILATEYHAEIDRIQFGDDQVGPVGCDDTGKHALTTTGVVPVSGMRDPAGGAVYAFDPGRLASAQDRVRASLLGNPVSVVVTPDGSASYVAVRGKHALAPLEWLPSGAVRQGERIPTCREPEQLELVRRNRRLVVRCNQGRALEVFGLSDGKLLKHVPLNGRAVDVAVSPDGEQAIVALSARGAGSVALVNLRTYEVKLVSLGDVASRSTTADPSAAQPTRVRLSPDGKVAIVMSDTSKVAWVLR